MSAAVLARYQPGGVLYQGPFGKVYTATEKANGRRVAFLGFSRPPGATPEQWAAAAAAYTHSLEQARRLEHPGIARVLEFGEDQGLYYVVSEWFDGETLQERLKRYDRFDPDQAFTLIGQAGRAVEHAAEMGLVHGDLTPDTLFLLRDGGVKVLNFGLGRCRPRHDSRYGSPEELRGQEPRPASDLFSLGLIFFQLVEGRHPFEAETPEQVQDRILRQPTPVLTSGTAAVRAISEKLLARSVEERYQSWAEVAADVVRSRLALPAPAAKSPEAVAVVASGVAQHRLHTSHLLKARQALQERRERRTEKVRRGGRFSLRMALLAALTVLAAHGLSRRAKEHTLTVAALEGRVDIASLVKRAWRKARPREPLQSLDVLRTSGRSRALLALGDGSRLLLGPEGTLGIREVRLRAKTGTRVRVFYLSRGILYSRVRTRPKQQFVIVTPFGSATVRGTEFVVRMTDRGFRVQTFSGSVEARTDGGTVRVKAGEQTTVAGERAPSKPAALEKAQRDAIAKVVGELARSVKENVLIRAVEIVEDNTVNRVGDTMAALAGMAGFNPSLKQGSAKARAQGGMQALLYAIEMGGTDDGYPQTLDSRTLAELGASDETREQILGQFKNRKLEYYRRSASGYEVAARVDDEEGTLLIGRNGKLVLKNPR